MTATAALRHLRMSPRKLRPLCNEVRGKKVGDAVSFLMACRRKAAGPLFKLLRSSGADSD